jgi:hypothetical protein
VHIPGRHLQKSKMTRIRSYTELSRIETFEDRFEYLSLKGVVGQDTFGFDRWINQGFYKSREWKRVRSHVIVRDQGCDLGVKGYEIYSDLLVHHMNPVMKEDIVHGEDWIIDPEFLIVTSHQTHNAIHYGDKNLLPRVPIVRQPGDTRLW